MVGVPSVMKMSWYTDFTIGVIGLPVERLTSAVDQDFRERERIDVIGETAVDGLRISIRAVSDPIRDHDLIQERGRGVCARDEVDEASVALLVLAGDAAIRPLRVPLPTPYR